MNEKRVNEREKKEEKKQKRDVNMRMCVFFFSFQEPGTRHTYLETKNKYPPTHNSNEQRANGTSKRVSVHCTPLDAFCYHCTIGCEGWLGWFGLVSPIELMRASFPFTLASLPWKKNEKGKKGSLRKNEVQRI